LEIIFRTLFIYLLLIVSMRAMGTRMASQLSRLELISLVALAAAIGVPVLGTKEGLLPGVIIAAVVVWCQRIISHQHLRNEKLEKKMLGDLEVLIDHGVYQWEAMKRSTISKNRIDAELRSEGVHHTGEVAQLIIESNGSFSLIQVKSPNPGLSVIPAFDQAFMDELFTQSEKLVCQQCGYERKNANKSTCTHCNKAASWVNAVKLK
jgi:uncharacterized membrane protein YcaP (DUF421 family)